MKSAMLFVSFGTSHEDTRVRTIDAIEAKVRDAFPDYAPYSAWTSGVIVRKVREERGEHHDTLVEALERMAADGVEDLTVSTTCMMDGAEMAKIRKAVDEWADARGIPARIASPLLSSREDRAAVARAVRDEFAHVGECDALLLMGHGSPYAPNEAYSQMQDELHALGCGRFFVATVMGTPTFDDAWPLVQASGAARVYLTPLMIVAGDHAANDLAGAGEGSWASMVAARGLEAVPVLKGLGEYAGIQQLVCDHVNDALMIREVALRGSSSRTAAPTRACCGRARITTT